MNKNAFFMISAKQTGDYFQFFCSECGGILKWKYIGRDPSIPRFEFNCPICKGTQNLKNNNFDDTNLILK